MRSVGYTGPDVPFRGTIPHQTCFTRTMGAPVEPLITSVVRTASKLLGPEFRSASPSASRSCASSVINSLAAFVPFSPIPATISVGCWVPVACPANSVPVAVRQTGMEGAWNGQSRCLPNAYMRMRKWLLLPTKCGSTAGSSLVRSKNSLNSIIRNCGL